MLVGGVRVSRYQEQGNEYDILVRADANFRTSTRALALLKMRGTDHDKSIPEFVIGSQGIKVMDKFDKGVEVMGGSSAAKVERVDSEYYSRLIEGFRKQMERQNK